MMMMMMLVVVVAVCVCVMMMMMMLVMVAVVCVCVYRIREISDQQKKFEVELEMVKKELTATQQSKQSLFDEHQALQMAFSSHEKKLKEIEAENDRLVR